MRPGELQVDIQQRLAAADRRRMEELDALLERAARCRKCGRRLNEQRLEWGLCWTCDPKRRGKTRQEDEELADVYEKRKMRIYFRSDAVFDAIMAESLRLERSMSWVVEECVKRGLELLRADHPKR